MQSHNRLAPVPAAVLLQAESSAKDPQKALHFYSLQMFTEKLRNLALQEIYIDFNAFYYVAYSYE